MAPLYLITAAALVAVLAAAVLAWRRPRLGVPLLLILAGLAAWTLWYEPRRLVVTRLTLPVEGLAAPVRAAVIGDLQPNPLHWPLPRLEAAIARAGAEAPDIVWLGDYAYDGGILAWLGLIEPAAVDPARVVAAMGRLTPPMGAYAVLGNHDWWWDGERMTALFRESGIRLLLDEVAVARHPGTGARLRIAGLDHLAPGRPGGPEQVLAGGGDAPTLVLTHDPDIFPRLPDGFALALAGHTHCGQVLIPSIGRPVVPIRHKKYACGLIEEDGRRFFVTAGIGTAILPVRFLTPPEIVVLELVPG